MPAVDLTRLRRQLNELMAYFQSPIDFHKELSAIFYLYANHALSFGDYAQSRSVIPSYHLPSLLIRQLELDLKPLILEDPQSALNLVDELWKDSYLEVRKTALFILNTVPLEGPTEIRSRLESWVSHELDKDLGIYLLSYGTRRLQSEYPKSWEAMVESWLTHDNPKMIVLGLQGLIEGIKNPDYKNLPVIFRMSSPLFQNPQHAYSRILQELIESLAARSQTETAFFIRQTLFISQAPEARKLIKNCLPFFTEDLQQDLISALNP